MTDSDENVLGERSASCFHLLISRGNSEDYAGYRINNLGVSFPASLPACHCRKVKEGKHVPSWPLVNWE
jgi:hypothetical protein